MDESGTDPDESGSEIEGWNREGIERGSGPEHPCEHSGQPSGDPSGRGFFRGGGATGAFEQLLHLAHQHFNSGVGWGHLKP